MLVGLEKCTGGHCLHIGGSLKSLGRVGSRKGELDLKWERGRTNWNSVCRSRLPLLAMRVTEVTGTCSGLGLKRADEWVWLTTWVLADQRPCGWAAAVPSEPTATASFLLSESHTSFRVTYPSPGPDRERNSGERSPSLPDLTIQNLWIDHTYYVQLFYIDYFIDFQSNLLRQKLKFINEKNQGLRGYMAYLKVQTCLRDNSSKGFWTQICVIVNLCSSPLHYWVYYPSNKPLTAYTDFSLSGPLCYFYGNWCHWHKVRGFTRDCFQHIWTPPHPLFDFPHSLDTFSSWPGSCS